MQSQDQSESLANRPSAQDMVKISTYETKRIGMGIARANSPAIKFPKSHVQIAAIRYK